MGTLIIFYVLILIGCMFGVYRSSGWDDISKSDKIGVSITSAIFLPVLLSYLVFFALCDYEAKQ